MIRYVSTRGASPTLSFADVVLAGLAPDGGLYVPDEVPALSPQDIMRLHGLDYPALAAEIMAPFTEGAFTKEALRTILEETYAPFRHQAVAPLTQTGTDEFLLELFHGPTLAFKDFALQCMGRLTDVILRERGEQVTVIGATSGDTGSAAIAGFAGRGNARIFILHPRGRCTEVQRRQMTTVEAENVHNLAVDGTFDDCQDIVKALFADAEFRARKKLLAVNSINWARILAQVVYYFYAALSLGAPARRVSFCVPTGNFGDIYAGYIAKRIGLPIEKLIIATNRNDILARCLTAGRYAMDGVQPTLSPSMDIQISSNFERLLFDLHDRDAGALAGLMQRFRDERAITLSNAAHARFAKDFAAASVDDDETLATIAALWRENEELVDPHTAVGIAAARRLRGEGDAPVVTLATAHPAKFPDAVEKAIGIRPTLPSHLEGLMEKPERCISMENRVENVKKYIEEHTP